MSTRNICFRPVFPDVVVSDKKSAPRIMYSTTVNFRHTSYLFPSHSNEEEEWVGCLCGARARDLHREGKNSSYNVGNQISSMFMRKEFNPLCNALIKASHIHEILFLSNNQLDHEVDRYSGLSKIDLTLSQTSPGFYVS